MTVRTRNKYVVTCDNHNCKNEVSMRKRDKVPRGWIRAKGSRTVWVDSLKRWEGGGKQTKLVKSDFCSTTCLYHKAAEWYSDEMTAEDKEIKNE